MKTKKILPGILAILGVAAGLAAVYFAVEESPEAHEAVKEAEKEAAEKGEEFKKTDEVITMATHLKKTAVATGVAVGFVAGSYISGAIAIGAVGATAYAWQKRYLDLDKALSKMSPEMRKKLHIDQAKEAVEKKFKSGEVKEKKESKTPFSKRRSDEEFAIYEEYTDQIIWTTENKILKTRDMMARHIASGKFLSFNNVIASLGGKPSNDPSIKRMGWSVNNVSQQEYFYESEDGFFVDIALEAGGQDHFFDKEMLYVYFSVPPMDADELEYDL